MKDESRGTSDSTSPAIDYTYTSHELQKKAQSGRKGQVEEAGECE